MEKRKGERGLNALGAETGNGRRPEREEGKEELTHSSKITSAFFVASLSDLSNGREGEP